MYLKIIKGYKSYYLVLDGNNFDVAKKLLSFNYGNFCEKIKKPFDIFKNLKRQYFKSFWLLKNNLEVVFCIGGEAYQKDYYFYTINISKIKVVEHKKEYLFFITKLKNKKIKTKLIRIRKIKYFYKIRGYRW